MLSLCPLVSRLSLATRTSANRILKGKTIPALANSGVQANRVIVTRTFSVKSDLEGDDGSGGSKNKENNASIPLFFHAVSFPDFLNDSREDFDVSILWFHTNKEKNAFLGGRHGEMVPIKVNSILEVPSGILPCCIKESNKEEMYRLHMEDQETQTPEKLAKDFNTAAETVDAILLVRDALKNGNKLKGVKDNDKQVSQSTQPLYSGLTTLVAGQANNSQAQVAGRALVARHALVDGQAHFRKYFDNRVSKVS